MSRPSRLTYLTTLALLGLSSPFALADEIALNASDSRMATFVDASGETSYALSLMAKAGNKEQVQTPVVILVDTSASQVGPVRDDAIDVVRFTLQNLGVSRQVSMMACDNQTVDLSGGLHTAHSDKMQEAVERLTQRIPMGATNLPAALRLAASQLPQGGSIIYIGDGLTRSGLLDDEGYRALVDSLVANRVTVTSLALGAEVDVECLATLANHTGGAILLRETTTGTAQDVGLALAQSTTVPIFWPTKSNIDQFVATSFPRSLPPIRSDRDSIVVGTLSEKSAAGKLAIDGEIGGKPAHLEWSLSPEASNADMAFLSAYVDRAEKAAGLYMPSAGSAALREVAALFSDSSVRLVSEAQFALQKGDLESARTIAEEALKLDPNNLEAKNILNAATENNGSAAAPKKLKVKLVGFQDVFGSDNPFGEEQTSEPAADSADDVFGETPAAGDEAPAGESPFGETEMDNAFDAQPEVSNDTNLDAPVPLPGTALEPVPSVAPAAPMPSTVAPAIGYSELNDGGDMLNDELRRAELRASALEAEVRAQLRTAAGTVNTNPEGTKVLLKQLLSEVLRSPDLDPATRARLQASVTSSIQKAARLEAEVRERLALSEAAAAQASQAQRLLADQARTESSVQQLVERFNALLEQQRFEQANTEIAPIVNNIARGSTIAIVTETKSNMESNISMNSDIIYAKRRGFVDVLAQNQKSSIPVSDEPPILYPPADVWRRLSARRLERYGSIDLAGSNPAEQRIYRTLNKTFSPAFNGATLRSVKDEIATQFDIPIIIDETSLDAAGISIDDPVQLEVPEITLRAALNNILSQLELTYVIDNEVMTITTSDKANARIIRVYPVGDLVVPVGGMMGGGMMGGMGGGMMGGMGGGMGGMGGGGMGGGGMGGMGGGGMGGGGMFDVTDKPTKTPNATQPAKVAPVKVDVEKHIDTRMSQLLDELEAATDEAAKDAVEAKMLTLINLQLNAVSQMVEDGKASESKVYFQGIINAVNNAVLRGHPQPWMYEALSISMQACEYPAQEVERVLTSALDFSNSIEDRLRLAKYFISRDMKKEALDLLHDASVQSPMQPEVYQMALPVAVELNDINAMRWACVGVLSQAWPQEQAALTEQAQLAAQVAFGKLMRDGRVVEAKAFENHLKLNVNRDIVVRVSWTGDADVDISVQEPTGTICSIGNPRTLSGGMLLGDASSLDKATSEGFSETYVCAKGFTGVYDVFIQKVWGNVTDGVVVVDILTDFGTENERHIRQHIQLDDKDAMVKVDVKNGHRQESVAQVAVTKTQAEKLATARAVLAQQAAATSTGDSSSTSTGSSFYFPTSGGVIGVPLNGLNPFRGAVGYQPQIRLIPAGTMLFSSAVISGDRRYVRVSPIPSFQAISQVNTFNFISGTSGTSNGATTGTGGNL